MKSFGVHAVLATLLIVVFLSFDIDAMSSDAILTINSFERHGDGGGPSECDGHFHSNDEMIVALSTGWYNGGARCHHFITITAGNGQTVRAQVVDECDSHRGCKNNIVDASKAVWNALGVSKSDWGWMKVTWSDA